MRTGGRKWQLVDVRPDPHCRALASIAARFTRHRVPYVVIGGFAVSRYLPKGQRTPDDLDVVLAPTLLAGRRAATAIASLVLRYRLDQNDLSALTVPPEQLADGEPLIMTTQLGTLHVLGSHLPPCIDRAKLVRQRRWVLVGGMPVAIANVEDLLDIKRTADHGRDAEDVAALERGRPRRARRGRPTEPPPTSQ